MLSHHQQTLTSQLLELVGGGGVRQVVVVA